MREKDMNHEPQGESAARPSYFVPITLCILYLGWFTFIGIASPVSVEMFRDFSTPFRRRIAFLSLFHWQWTIPFAIACSYLIVWKSKKLNRITSGWVDVLGLVLLLAFVLTYVLIWKSFIFKMGQA